jgi:hypothetical protein
MPPKSAYRSRSITTFGNTYLAAALRVKRDWRCSPQGRNYGQFGQCTEQMKEPAPIWRIPSHWSRQRCPRTLLRLVPLHHVFSLAQHLAAWAKVDKDVLVACSQSFPLGSAC